MVRSGNFQRTGKHGLNKADHRLTVKKILPPVKRGRVRVARPRAIQEMWSLHRRLNKQLWVIYLAWKHGTTMQRTLIAAAERQMNVRKWAALGGGPAWQKWLYEQRRLMRIQQKRKSKPQQKAAITRLLQKQEQDRREKRFGQLVKVRGW